MLCARQVARVIRMLCVPVLAESSLIHHRVRVSQSEGWWKDIGKLLDVWLTCWNSLLFGLGSTLLRFDACKINLALVKQTTDWKHVWLMVRKPLTGRIYAGCQCQTLDGRQTDKQVWESRGLFTDSELTVNIACSHENVVSLQQSAAMNQRRWTWADVAFCLFAVARCPSAAIIGSVEHQSPTLIHVWPADVPIISSQGPFGDSCASSLHSSAECTRCACVDITVVKLCKNRAFVLSVNSSNMMNTGRILCSCSY